MTDTYLNVCPYCHAALRIDDFQEDFTPLSGSKLHYSVCQNCGSVVRSYVEKDKESENQIV